MPDPLLTFSDALVSRVADSGIGLVCTYPGVGAQRTATLRRPGGLVTSEQGLPSNAVIPAVLPDGSNVQAQLIGRDSGTNVAVLRLQLDGPALPAPAGPRSGGLAPSGLAEQAVVLPGDILLSVDSAAASQMRAMANALGSGAAGTGVVFRLLRGGTPIELSVLAAARPAT